MRVTVHNIIIVRDMMTKTAKQVFSWEIPVLQAKHGGGNIIIEGDEVIERDLPQDDANEFERLVSAHGFDDKEGGTNMAFAEMAFGRGMLAHKELGKMIKKSKAKKSKSKPVPDSSEVAKLKAEVAALQEQMAEMEEAAEDPTEPGPEEPEHAASKDGDLLELG